jgi:hypothetical protein
VTSEGTNASLLGTVIPDFASGVDGTRDEETRLVVGGNGHDITLVVIEDGLGVSLFDVPKDQSSITGRSEDFRVGDEATARQVTLVLREFGVDLLDGGFLLTTFREFVKSAQVVQTTASNEIAGRRVAAGHDPRGTERDGVELVGGPGVPDLEERERGKRQRRR